MKFTPFLTLLLALTALAQQHDVAITAFPNVIAPTAHWTLAWQGTDNADGIIASPDGGLLFAQEQPSRVSKLDKHDKVSVYLEDTHGGGALTFDSKDRLFTVARTCTDPGKNPAACTEATHLAELKPDRKALADNVYGKSLGRLNDLIADKKGGFYFNGAALYYLRLQYPAQLLPPSHVFEAMRNIVAGRPVSQSSLLVGIALAMFYLALAGFFFTRIFKYVVRSGLIARYSAESVS